MKNRIAILITCLLAVFMFMAGSSQASFIGYIYEGDSTAAFNPALGPTAGILLTSTFTVDQLNFDTRITGNSYSGFLGGPGNVNNLNWIGPSLAGNIVTASDPLYPSFTPSPSAYGTFFQFTGTAYFPENIAITHDDGFWLNLGGTIYDFSDPTSPYVDHLVNAAGVYNFTLNYGAWNSFPEVLQVPVSSVPEPMTLLLIGLGMLGVAGIRRKLRS